MKDNSFRRALEAIRPLDRSLEPALRAHLDDLTKPRGSLGRLEDLAVRIGLVQAAHPVDGPKRIVTFAADHGVAAEGVSAYPAAVTPQMVRNMLAGGAAINVLARHAGADLRVVDIGVNDPLDNAPGLVRRKVAPGTANIAAGPAMTREQAAQALSVGVDLAEEAAADGIRFLGTGEMGIANTTAAAALYSALLPAPPMDTVGRGTGIDDAVLMRKVRVVERALETNADALDDPLTALAAVGGFEIAGIAGLILGAATRRMVVVVDGFISGAAALVAVRMAREVRDALVFSHRSDEAGHALLFDALDAKPLLDLNLRLGEGTGAALAFNLCGAAIRLYHEMATFSGAGVSDRDERAKTSASPKPVN